MKALGTISFLFALICDCAALLFFDTAKLLGGDRSFVVLLLFHFGAILFATVGFFSVVPSLHRAQRWTPIATAIGFTLAVPLLGTLALIALARILNESPAEDPAAKFVFGESQTLTEVPFEPQSGATPLSVLQILSGGGGDLRRNAILSVRNVEPRRAIPVLRKAIQDSDEQVRLLAQTQFNRIVGSLELAIKKMGADLARGPRSTPLLLRLAEQYHELVHLGISSAETESIYLERASELLVELLDAKPTQTDARFLLLKCQVKRTLSNEAEQTARLLEEQNFPDHLLAPWRVEVHFQRKDWAAVAKLTSEMRAQPKTDPRLKPILDLWAPA